MAITYHAGRRTQGTSTDNATTTETITATGTYTVDQSVGSYDNDKQGFFVATTSSVVYGKTINSVSFWLKKSGSPTGNAYIRVWSNSGLGNVGTQEHEFGSIDVSTLTTSYVKHTFSTGSWTLAVNDTVGVEWTGVSVSNTPVLQGVNTNVYDGTDTIRNRNTVGGTFSPASSGDIKFEVTVGQSKPANAQAGSRFEETDTRKMYHMTNDYKVHTFLLADTGNTFNVSGSGDVEYLVVAGGAGGGYGAGGGGGAGGYITATGHAVTAQNYTITVGTGGTAGAGGTVAGGAGGNSVFDTITSTGGGGGGGEGSRDGNDGGSGGGGKALSSGGTATPSPSQGFDGGNGSGSASSAARNSGGGGGATEAGVAATTSSGGNGGAGTSSSITGSAVVRAGGGGGGCETSDTAGTGGSGGGGAGKGGSSPAAGDNGSANTGGGGGGGSLETDVANQNGGTGGSGIVIIRYKTTSGITATGGTVTDLLRAWTEEGT